MGVNCNTQQNKSSYWKITLEFNILLCEKCCLPVVRRPSNSVGGSQSKGRIGVSHCKLLGSNRDSRIVAVVVWRSLKVALANRPVEFVHLRLKGTLIFIVPVLSDLHQVGVHTRPILSFADKALDMRLFTRVVDFARRDKLIPAEFCLIN